MSKKDFKSGNKLRLNYNKKIIEKYFNEINPFENINKWDVVKSVLEKIENNIDLNEYESLIQGNNLQSLYDTLLLVGLKLKHEVENNNEYIEHYTKLLLSSIYNKNVEEEEIKKERNAIEIREKELIERYDEEKELTFLFYMILKNNSDTFFVNIKSDKHNANFKISSNFFNWLKLYYLDKGYCSEKNNLENLEYISKKIEKYKLPNNKSGRPFSILTYQIKIFCLNLASLLKAETDINGDNKKYSNKLCKFLYNYLSVLSLLEKNKGVSNEAEYIRSMLTKK